MIVNQLSIRPRETKFINPDDYLQTGWTIRGRANADNTVNIQISGVELT